jgi:hypothetical protein
VTALRLRPVAALDVSSCPIEDTQHAPPGCRHHRAQALRPDMNRLRRPGNSSPASRAFAAGRCARSRCARVEGRVSCGQCGLLLDWASDHGAFSAPLLEAGHRLVAEGVLPAAFPNRRGIQPIAVLANIVSVTARLLPNSICSDRASLSSLSCHHAIIWCGSPIRSLAALELGELYALASAT